MSTTDEAVGQTDHEPTHDDGTKYQPHESCMRRSIMSRPRRGPFAPVLKQRVLAKAERQWQELAPSRSVPE